MHRRTALLLVALVALAGTVGATAAAADGTHVAEGRGATTDRLAATDARQAAANGTVAGTVTAPNGTADAIVAAVPVGNSGLFEKTSPAELHDLLRTERSDDLYTTGVGADGEYALSLPGGRNYTLIAVTSSDASETRRVAVASGERTRRDLAIRASRPLRLHVGAGDGLTGETVAVTVDARNVDSEAVRNLSVALSLPDGWTVVETTAGRGSWDGERGVWTVPTLDPQDPTSLRLVVAVGDDPGEYAVDVRATAPSPGGDGAAVDLGSASDAVTVREERETTTGTTRVPGGDGSEAGTTTVVDDPSPVPGFGVTVALVGIAFAVVPFALGTLLARRR